MKNKNGFTLIELLAIIVILAIIAVITVPIISDTMEKSRKDAAKDSTYGYVDAVNRLYYSKSLNNEDDVEDGIYTVSQLKTVGVSVNGSEPSDGWVELENNEVVAYSIKIGKYVITKYRDSELVCEKGDVQPDESTSKKMKISEKVDTYVKAALTANSSITGETVKTVSEMSSITTNPADSGWIHFNKVNDNVVVVDYSLTYGDLTANYSSLTNGNYVSTFGETRNKPVIIVEGSTINIGEEEFYVMSVNNGTVKLLASNCLIEVSAGVYRQKTSSDTASCKKTTFSSTDYWNDSTTHAPKTVYQSDIDGTTVTSYSSPYPYVYNVQGTDTNNVDDIVNSYVGTLSFKSSNGAVGRLMSYTEANGLNSTVRKIGVKYWLGSGYGNCLGIMEDYGAINLGGIDYKSSLGVRPVIVISTSDI